ncbi:MAG: efflux RND transporter periplasmic adaptor subunit, partial [Akkermansiaceae bacterium]|nr:efflux RND transporter periplasmic adaptor subunit [Akkermansiaceae bacterium]
MKLLAVLLLAPPLVLAADPALLTLPEGSSARLGIVAEVPAPRHLSDPVRATGLLRCDPASSAVVAAPVSGQIAEDTLRVGDRVAQGAPLLTLRSGEVARLITSYLEAEQKLRFARTAAERERELAKRNLTPGEALQQKEAEYQQARTAHLSAIQPMHLLGLDEGQLHEMVESAPKSDDLTEFRIVAPRAGVIVEKETTPGMPVAAQDVLLRIAATDPLLLEFQVPLRGVGRVRPGERVAFRATVGEPREGSATILGIAPAARAETVAATALAKVANADGLWISGTPVEILLGDPAAPALPAVPNGAVLAGDDGPYVFIREGPETYRPLRVEVTARTSTHSGLSGLSADAAVVVRG